METAFHAKVRERAYHLWVEEGRPEGRAEHHWVRAEIDLSTSATTKAKPAPKRTPRAKRKLS